MNLQETSACGTRLKIVKRTVSVRWVRDGIGVQRFSKFSPKIHLLPKRFILQLFHGIVLKHISKIFQFQKKKVHSIKNSWDYYHWPKIFFAKREEFRVYMMVAAWSRCRRRRARSGAAASGSEGAGGPAPRAPLSW